MYCSCIPWWECLRAIHEDNQVIDPLGGVDGEDDMRFVHLERLGLRKASGDDQGEHDFSCLLSQESEEGRVSRSAKVDERC